MTDRPELHFVLGVTQRCGTDFLAMLLRAHPDCSPVDRIHEDFLLAEFDKLIDFAQAVRSHWNPKWDLDGGLNDRLLLGLGRACAEFLTDLASDKQASHVVAKTPSVRNLSLLGNLNTGRSLVLVRDGRAVVESGMRSFGWHFDVAARKWAMGVDTVIRARAQRVDFLLVRYEDLVINLESEMRRILAYLGLDVELYDFAAAQDLPVAGSSTLGRLGDGLHWQPVNKDSNFQPLHRFDHWTDKLHRRFDWLASEQLVELGYEPKGHDNRISNLSNRVRDLRRPLIYARQRAAWDQFFDWIRKMPRPG